METLHSPILVACYHAAHVKWARQHLNWHWQNWNNVFTDESRFNIRHADGRELVDCRNVKQHAGVFVRQRDRYGGGSNMVWTGL